MINKALVKEETSYFTTAAESVVKSNINLRDLWLSNMLAARRELRLKNIYILVVITQKLHIRTAGFNHVSFISHCCILFSSHLHSTYKTFIIST